MSRFWPFGESRSLVRGIEKADLQQCADIHAGSFANSWGDGEIANMLAANNVHGLVVETNPSSGNVSGFVIYRISAKEAEILTIAVDPKKRRGGAGRKLLLEMIRLCLGERLEEIFLEVDANNKSAIALYGSEGFKKVGERKAYYNAPSSATGEDDQAGDALIMRLDLLG